MSNVYGFTHIAVALSLALGVAVTAFADDPGFPAPTGDPAFVPAGAKLERLFDGGCMLTEGVAAGHDGMIYFSDITFTKFCKDSRQPPCRVRHEALSGGLWIPRAFRLPAFASCAILCPLWTWPALAMGLLTGSRPQRGYHVPHRQDASGELASLRREPGTVSAKPLIFAGHYSRKDVSATFVPLCVTTLQPRLHVRSTRV